MTRLIKNGEDKQKIVHDPVQFKISWNKNQPKSERSTYSSFSTPLGNFSNIQQICIALSQF
jgi:hypothetical protein